jgi:CheY-like chemotaxis protein
MADEPKLAGARVLIVEDEALSALVAEEMLEELGCVAAGVARSVEAALAALESGEAIDCVMLDVRLGQELSSEIASRLIQKETPFIICSGYGIKLPGMNIPVLDKPYTLQTLGQALSQAMARQPD